jgi:cation diffusion facilitator CzcD-associated flavoprotein CzcO
MKFNTRCTGATWDEESSQWAVSLQKKDGPSFEVTCDVFVSAVGRLNNWQLPQVEGIELFEGQLIHTANWPRDYDFSGKDVAVIGNGASGVQCVAAMSNGQMPTSNHYIPFTI